MDIGLLTGLASLVALISGFMVLVVNPVKDLTTSVTRLVTILDGVNEKQTSMRQDIVLMDARLDIIEHTLLINGITKEKPRVIS